MLYFDEFMSNLGHVMHGLFYVSKI